MKQDKVYRYRKCSNKRCKHRFKTVEYVADGLDHKAVVDKIRQMVR